MKKLLLFTSLLFSFSTLSAQITLSQSDLPQQGENWVFFEDMGAGIPSSMSPPGGNQNWNFSTQWNLTDTTYYQYVNVNSLPNSSVWPAANLGLIINSSGNTTNAFMTSSPSGLYIEGAEASFMGVFDIKFYFENLALLQLPMTYGYTSTDTVINSSVLISLIGGPAEKVVNYSVINYTCDAWGSLTTPLQTADVLRVRSLVTSNIDSNFTDNSGLGTNWTFDNTENFGPDTDYDYTFYKNGPGTLMMECSATVTTGLIKLGYYLENVTSNVQDVNDKLKTTAFPNPVSDVLNIQMDDPGAVNFRIFDHTGREVFAYNVSGVDRISVGTLQFNSGLYHYFLYNVNGNIIGNGKVIVQH